MDNHKPVDNPSVGSDNDAQMKVDDVLYINMADRRPLNDPTCKHRNLVKDEAEELGDAFQCPDCKIGWIVARN